MSANSEVISNPKVENNAERDTESTIRQLWDTMLVSYDPISWDPEDPETRSSLTINDPENFVSQISLDMATKQLAQVDLELFIRQLSLLVRVTEVNGIQLNKTSKILSLLKTLYSATKGHFDEIGYAEIYILSDTAKTAAKLFQAISDADMSELKNDLIHLSHNGNRYLESEGTDIGRYDPKEFEPDKWRYIPGEEEYYNNRHAIFEDEEAIYSNYNISEDTKNNAFFFKSSGVFISVPSDGDSSIDFTPYNNTRANGVNRHLGIKMLYRGMVNFFYALDRGEIGVTDKKTIKFSKNTNRIMASFAIQFGFKVQIDGEMLELETIMNRRIKLTEHDYWISGDIEEVRTATNNFLNDPSKSRLRQRIFSDEK